MPAGDAVVQWGSLPKRRDYIALLIKFLRPIECAAVIEFDIAKQGILVEHILQSNGLYIQAGKRAAGSLFRLTPGSKAARAFAIQR